MKSTIIKPTLKFTVYLELDEVEAQALAAITLYGSGPFLEMFYKYLGRTYLHPHEEGLKSLFNSITDRMKPPLKEALEFKKKWTDK